MSSGLLRAVVRTRITSTSTGGCWRNGGRCNEAGNNRVAVGRRCRGSVRGRVRQRTCHRSCPAAADVGPGCVVLRYSPRHTAGYRAPTPGVALKAKPTCARTEASGKCCLRRSSQSARTITRLPNACPGTAAANNPLTVASSTWAPFARL